MFEYINEVVQEASMATCDAILNYIDKCESFKEFSTSEDFDEYVQESMMYFVEYVSKDKDEITKWMNEKGYFYTGDNPKKKKETLRMYNFLKQHDFRPSDQTYKTDIDDGKGGKIREKLLIDPGQNKTIRTFPEVGDTMSSNKELKDIRSGDNSTFTYNTNSGDSEIKIGSKELKGKQQYSQQTLKHEEGHLDAFLKSGKQDLMPRDNTTAEAIDMYNKLGQPSLNAHDNSNAEAYADKYGAKHAKMRRSHNKQSKMTDEELLKSFRKIHLVVDNNCKYATKTLKEMEKSISRYENSINNIKNKLADGRSFDTTEIIRHVSTAKRKLADESKGLFHYIYDLQTYRQRMNEALDDLRHTAFWQRDSAYYNKENSYKLFKETHDKYVKVINKLVKELSPEKLKEFKEMIPIMKITSRVADSHITKREFSDETLIGREKLKEIDAIENMTDEEKDQIMSSNVIAEKSEIAKDIKEYEDEIKECKKTIKEMNKTFMWASKELNQSTNFRYQYARQFIKEYFEEYFNDFVYND